MSVCVLADLSYSPDLALTLMSAVMRGARARACSCMSHRDSELKLTAYIYLATPDFFCENNNFVCIAGAI